MQGCICVPWSISDISEGLVPIPELLWDVKSLIDMGILHTTKVPGTMSTAFASANHRGHHHGLGLWHTQTSGMNPTPLTFKNLVTYCNFCSAKLHRTPANFISSHFTLLTKQSLTLVCSRALRCCHRDFNRQRCIGSFILLGCCFQGFCIRLIRIGKGQRWYRNNSLWWYVESRFRRICRTFLDNDFGIGVNGYFLYVGEGF
ncbi:hypothetical protein EJ08DRAFT_283443 [Tothia fuscella]|uniref:Uncharacterized protein n=1 Tax=Tothia fuscella TaxID=1048955 RepID=A0A9P4P2L2_9PEZI|nr:hypothetical protein EJ08DRAFT_283443 [Tothia fuscella]